jgi:LysM repeat protein
MVQIPRKDGLSDVLNSSLIAQKNGLSLSDLNKWNPVTAKDDCKYLQVDQFLCVGIIGGSTVPTTTSTTPSSTSPNGIATPTPTQPGMVSNCKAFYLVKSGETCTTVANENGITVAQVEAWNPGAGSDCRLLQANAWACVGVLQ